MTMESELLSFRKFYPGDADNIIHEVYDAAVDKLQTLYPGNRITQFDHYTIGIASDSLYSENGIDLYELGMVDEELYAMRRKRDGHVIYLRV